MDTLPMGTDMATTMARGLLSLDMAMDMLMVMDMVMVMDTMAIAMESRFILNIPSRVLM